MQIMLPEAILSYPSLGKPQPNKFQPDQAPRFKADLIFPKGTDLTELNHAIASLVADDFKGVEPKNKPLKSCTTRVDKQSGLPLAVYSDGDFYMSPWSGEDHPPVLLSPQAKTSYPAQNFKGGNRVRASIRLWAGTGFGGTIGAQLLAVQWLSDGKPVTPTADLSGFSAVPPTTPTDIPGFSA